MKIKITKLLFILICIFQIQLTAQEKFTISGYIEDAASGEKLISANVFDTKSLQGNTTNTYGFYSLTLPKDSAILAFSYIGYETQVVPIYLDKDMTINIKLNDELALSEITVTEKRLEKIEESAQMSRVEVPIAQIKKLPALLGEVDVLKTLQLLPGVQSGGEGQSGLYVRGGSPDQNLVLLDGVPIYNVSHVLGIFSVFNADAIKNVTLTKGGFPARYGGRLSSVLEINMKEGNLQEWHGEGSIGLISSKMTVEGPIIKDKLSILVSGRRTYADIIFRPIIKSQATGDEEIDPTLFFYDLNAKLQYKVNKKHRIFLSMYNGKDVFANKFKQDDTTTEGGIDWGNIIGALRWNYEISNKLFANTTLTLSNYDIDFFNSIESKNQNTNQNEVFSAKYLSGIRDFGGKIDFDYIPNPNHYIRFGTSATHHRYSPGALSFKAQSGDIGLDTLIGQDQLNAVEYALYVEDDMKFGAFRANVGLHVSGFSVNDEFYSSVQPRLGLRYLLSNDWAIKGAFSTMTQYLNLLTSEALSLPTDLWVPSTKLIKPQTSWQVAGGVAKTLWDEYEFSAEGFYKEMKNVVSYKEGANFFNAFAADWQSKITQGDGESYGLELFLQKKKGKTTGWIGYTLAWNNRTFDKINGGKTFPYRYDRRHDLSIVVSHQFSKKISCSAAWIYGTGNSISLPIAKYQAGQFENNYYGYNPFFNLDEVELLGDKNAFRMSDYHRLDFSIEFFKQRKRYERRWIFSVYNAYWNSNPYFIIRDSDYDPNTNTYNDVLKEISILPIIPSFSYAIKF